MYLYAMWWLVLLCGLNRESPTAPKSECSRSDSKLAGTFNIDYRHGARPRGARRGTRRFARAFAGGFLAGGSCLFLFLAIAIFLRLHGCSRSVGLTGPCSVYGTR